MKARLHNYDYPNDYAIIMRDLREEFDNIYKSISELEAEPVEESKLEWEKKFEDIPQNNYYQQIGYKSPDGETSYKAKIRDFIRTEVISKICEEIKEKVVWVDGYKVVKIYDVGIVEARWLGRDV